MNYTVFPYDAGTMSEEDLEKLPPHGPPEVRSFCGIGPGHVDWDRRGICVLKARRGYGKTHLLLYRSRNHRDHDAAARVLFYPNGGRPPELIDRFGNLHAALPRWLHGREAMFAWSLVWQLAIVGLLVPLVGAPRPALRGYSDWFGSLFAGADDGKPAPQPNLTHFIDKVLERVVDLDITTATDLLRKGMHMGNEWSIAIKSALDQLQRARVVLYLDAPDELVRMGETGVWRNIQQSLLYAIWKFTKDGTWSSTLHIYASVRSEAFGSMHDHSDLQMAMDHVLALDHYSTHDLEAMVNDKIEQLAPADALLLPLGSCKPLEALCGFAQVKHADRFSRRGEAYMESVLAALLRHSHGEPRDLVAMLGAIIKIEPPLRGPLAIAQAVNDCARLNTQRAIDDSFLGWGEVHRSLAARLPSEVIDAATMTGIMAGRPEFREALKLLVRHGLLGVADPAHSRHRHCYRQRFLLGDVHGGQDATWSQTPYYFVHPAFKEWVKAQVADNGGAFAESKDWMIGDGCQFESAPPLIQVGFKYQSPNLWLRGQSVMRRADRLSDALTFLFVVCCAYRQSEQAVLTAEHLGATWARLKAHKKLGQLLRLPWPSAAIAGEKFGEWLKNAGRDPNVKAFFSTLRSASRTPGRLKRKEVFIGVSDKSAANSVPYVWVSDLLPLEEVELDDELRKCLAA